MISTVARALYSTLRTTFINVMISFVLFPYIFRPYSPPLPQKPTRVSKFPLALPTGLTKNHATRSHKDSITAAFTPDGACLSVVTLSRCQYAQCTCSSVPSPTTGLDQLMLSGVIHPLGQQGAAFPYFFFRPQALQSQCGHLRG